MKRLPLATPLSLVIAALLSACASTPEPAAKQEVAAAKDKDVVCDREVKLGTLFPKVKCRTAQQIEAERADARAVADAVATNPSLPQQ